MSRDPEELIERVKHRGFTPSMRDLPRLLELLATPHRDLAKQVVAALVRLGRAALPEMELQFAAATPPARARLCEAIGTVGGIERAEWLVGRLEEADGATRRRAATRLAKLPPPAVAEQAVPALMRALARTEDPADRRALTEALGKLADARALTVLADAQPHGMNPDDALSLQRLATARVRIKQRALREQASTVSLDVRLPESTPVLLHVRAGLEPLLISELAPICAAGSVRLVGRGRVRVMWHQALAPLFRARTFLHLGFPLAVNPELPPVQAVVEAMTLPSTVALMRTLTLGPVRYRVHWSSEDARRSDTQKVATAVESKVPWLVNDPSQAPWEVIVTTVPGPSGIRTFVELWPKRLADPRFAYRQATMPASSHPTIAAALAQVAGVRVEDVVWDPFVGTGMELIERAHAGPFAALHGTDVDQEAIAAARRNLASAGVAGTLLHQDARAFAPPVPLSLVITNPPFGQRVPVPGGVEALLEQVLDHAVTLLGPRGRVAFVTPRAAATGRVLSQRGLTRLEQLLVDVGGFSAHLELWRR